MARACVLDRIRLLDRRDSVSVPALGERPFRVYRSINHANLPRAVGDFRRGYAAEFEGV